MNTPSAWSRETIIPVLGVRFEDIDSPRRCLAWPKAILTVETGVTGPICWIVIPNRTKNNSAMSKTRIKIQNKIASSGNRTRGTSISIEFMAI